MTSLTTALRRRLRRIRADRDRGTSLMELVVGMTIMSIFMAIVTVAVIQMFSAINTVQAVENSSTQLNTAFDRLDKQLRYATAIDQEVFVSGNWYVAFESVGPTTPLTTCTQLMIGTIGSSLQSQLSERTSTLVDSTGAVIATPTWTDWTPLAAGVSAASTDRPFTVPQPVVSSQLQQLDLNLQATDGTGASARTSFSRFTFTALNSGAAASAALSVWPPVALCPPAAIS